MSQSNKKFAYPGKPRREFLKLGAAAAGGGLLLPAASGLAAEQCAAPMTNNPFNGSTCPFPIPWLDKNGSNNQMPKPGTEPSNIFHFKGFVARCNDWVGMGTDNKGNHLAFGSPTTDFSVMSGEYYAARAPQKGVFAHI